MKTVMKSLDEIIQKAVPETTKQDVKEFGVEPTFTIGQLKDIFKELLEEISKELKPNNYDDIVVAKFIEKLKMA